MADRLTARVHKFDRAREAGEYGWDGNGRESRRSLRRIDFTTLNDGNCSQEALTRKVQWVSRAETKLWRMLGWGRQVKRGGKKRSRRDTWMISAIEIGPTNGMVHVHALVYGEFIAKERLEALWAQALGAPVARTWMHTVADAGAALKEVVKYVAKGAVIDTPDIGLLANTELAFRNVHRVRIRGILREVKIDEKDGAYEDLRVEDVHEIKAAACEACGCMYDWSWRRIVSQETVEVNGGYGLWRERDLSLPPEFAVGAPDWFRPPGG